MHIPEVDLLSMQRLDDAHVDCGVRLSESAQPWDQPAHGHGRYRGDDQGVRNPEVPGAAAGGVDRVERQRKAACEIIGMGKRPQTIAIAGEERTSEPVLKRFDLVADRALRDEQFICRRAERSAADDCFEGTQGVEWREYGHVQAM